AVEKHASLMRASIASPGNDLTLGASEAPPAIISVFLGSLLTKILDNIEKGVAAEGTQAQIIELNVGAIPTVSKDYTDRNRTSPFAFTGNKFEFRAVGSSANVSVPVAYLNTAVADLFEEATERLQKLISDKGGRDEAVMELVREFVSSSKAIRFEGNNYSDEWKQEAAKRGLPILSSTPEALEVLRDEKVTSALVRMGVLTSDEIKSRYNVAVERYVKTLLIEHETMLEMAQTLIVPSIETQVIKSQTALDEAVSDSFKRLQKDRVIRLESMFENVLEGVRDLEGVLEKCASIHDETEKMNFIKTTTIPVADTLRKAVDAVEGVIDDRAWPLPKYREMLFTNDL
ncbi:MAG: glutamine synthetase type III, partial [Bdellovibrionales bacterium]|nr:glutamine synthetase type III [Bdellovibrionales bacterium]